MSNGSTERESTNCNNVPDGPGLILRLLPIFFFLSVVVIVLYQCSTSLREQGYDSGTPITNAALYPRLLVAVLLAMIMTQAFKEFRHLGVAIPEELGTLTQKRLIQIVQCSFLSISYLLFLPIVGFLALTPVFVSLTLFSLADRDYMNILIFSILLTLGCSLVFQGLFNVNLPRGMFGIAINI